MTSPTLIPYIEAAEYGVLCIEMREQSDESIAAVRAHAARLRALAEALREAKIGWHHSDGQGMYDVFPGEDPEQLRLEEWQQQWFIPAPKEEA